MNNKNLVISSAAALVALVAVSGIAFSTFASEAATTDQNPAATQKGFFGRNLTDEQKLEWQSEREAKRAERQAEMEAVRTAIEAGDYNAWKTAVDADAPILGKINEGNFSKLVEMHNLSDQANDIREELGIERGDMHGADLGGKRNIGMKRGCGMNYR